MRIAILDGKSLNPGDLDWSPIMKLGETALYDETSFEDFGERTKDATVLAINKIPLKGKYLRKLSPSVRLICLFATGYDNVDLSYFNEHGIPVCNVAAYGTTDVAQHTMALILDICRHISQHSASVHAGDWIQRGTWCYWLKSPVLLDGLTLGIIGFGAIGRRVGEMAHDFGMSVLANCRTPRNPPSYVPFSFASKKQVLQESDISAHPGN